MSRNPDAVVAATDIIRARGGKRKELQLGAPIGALGGAQLLVMEFPDAVGATAWTWTVGPTFAFLPLTAHTQMATDGTAGNRLIVLLFSFTGGRDIQCPASFVMPLLANRAFTWGRGFVADNALTAFVSSQIPWCILRPGTLVTLSHSIVAPGDTWEEQTLTGLAIPL